MIRWAPFSLASSPALDPAVRRHVCSVLAAALADSIAALSLCTCALALQSGGREADRAAANNPARLVRYDSAPPDMGWHQNNYEQRSRGLSDVDQRSGPGMGGPGPASLQQQQREREQQLREQREREQREQQLREQREREQQQQREREQRERQQQQQQQKAAQQQPGIISARPGGGGGVAPAGWSGDHEVDTMQNEMRSLGLGATDHMAGGAGNHSLLSSLHDEQSAAEVERARQQVRPSRRGLDHPNVPYITCKEP